ncbi:hypothetical protein [Chryseobacterium sp.]|uniref:hypothetical protein n=1 Tax=Chryseobacterium sp. TaxID=1871047 RepID=UPI0012F93BB9
MTKTLVFFTETLLMDLWATHIIHPYIHVKDLQTCAHKNMIWRQNNQLDRM